MRRTVTNAIAVGVFTLVFAACGGSKSSDSSGGSSTPSTTTTASGGGSAAKGGVDLTVAAAGAVPETHITSDKAPTSCQLESAATAQVDIVPSAVTGLGPSDSIGLTTTIVKLTVGGVDGMDKSGANDRIADHLSVKTTGSSSTLTIDALPIELGDTATTMSGTVTCPKG
jgi:hypothetical protein